MRNKHTKEKLEVIIKESKSWGEVCRALGIKAATGAQTHLKNRAMHYNIDFSHFLGQSHAKGKSFKKKDAITYCYKGSKEPSHRLKMKLFRDGLKKKECEICKLNEWMGQELPLELDHIDSDHSNNEFSNLQILCPNCHSIETRKRRV